MHNFESCRPSHAVGFELLGWGLPSATLRNPFCARVSSEQAPPTPACRHPKAARRGLHPPLRTSLSNASFFVLSEGLSGQAPTQRGATPGGMNPGLAKPSEVEIDLLGSGRKEASQAQPLLGIERRRGC